MSPPFGYSLETTNLHMEAPKKKEMIEKVSLFV
jgi:hypothetical protein